MRADLNDLDEQIVSAIAWTVDGKPAAANLQHPAVKEIRYHPPDGIYDAHFADVYMVNGAIQRVFNLTQVVFNYEESSDDTEGSDGSQNQSSSGDQDDSSVADA